MKVAFLALALVAAPLAVRAQVAATDPRSVEVAGAQPFAVAQRRIAGSFVSVDGSRISETYGFYVLWDRAQHRLWARGQSGARPGALIIRRDGDTPAWADSRSCAGLQNAIVAMEDIESPTLDVPGLGAPSAERLVMDGVFYELWTRSSGWGEDTGYGLTYASNVNTALAEWIEAVRTAAEPCWTETAPTT